MYAGGGGKAEDCGVMVKLDDGFGFERLDTDRGVVDDWLRL